MGSVARIKAVPDLHKERIFPSATSWSVAQSIRRRSFTLALHLAGHRQLVRL